MSQLQAVELFAWIQDDIKKKYNIDPIFSIHQKIQQNDEIISWIQQTFYEDESYELYQWPFYKHLSKNIFQLKGYIICPPRHVCQQRIDTFFLCVPEASSHSDIFNIGFFRYTRSEARMILFIDLNKNSSEYQVESKQTIDEHTEILEICSYAWREVYHLVSDGYMPLSYEK